MGCIKDDDVRDEGRAYDLDTQAGVRIEVKSAAYVQSWQQSRLSKISFNVPKTFGWDRETNKFDTGKNVKQMYMCLLSYSTKIKRQ